jgi:hypothetical protein
LLEDIVFAAADIGAMEFMLAESAGAAGRGMLRLCLA